MSLAGAWHTSLYFHIKHRPHHTMGDKAFAERNKRPPLPPEWLLPHLRKVALGMQKLRAEALWAYFRFQDQPELPYGGRGDLRWGQ